MRVKNKVLTILAALSLMGPATSLVPNNVVTTNASVRRRAKKSVRRHIKTWDYPFANLNKYGVRPMYNAQVFGKTNYKRSAKPLSYFHDGWDFGWSEVGHSTVKAIHAGRVKEVAYGNGLGWFVWVISPDGYVEIYQEGFKKRKDISVKAGQHVRLGQKIGRLTGSHLHLGLTKTNKNYINVNGFPCNNWFRNNGTWLNPVSTIKRNLRK